MQDVVKAAAVQMDVTWLDPDANLTRMATALEGLARQGQRVEIVVLPERANLGSIVSRDYPEFRDFSVKYLSGAARVPGPFTDGLGEIARKHNTYIVCGITELHPTIAYGLYNSVVLIGPTGDLLGVHRKAQVPGDEKHYFFAGNKLEVYATELGKLTMMVCADSTFPELPRVAALKGAEIICVPYANTKSWTRDPAVFQRMVSVRAFENNIFFVACNRVGKDNNQVFAGNSCICSPWGDFLALSEGDDEEVVQATLYREELEAARANYVRFRDRRPELYGSLCEPV